MSKNLNLARIVDLKLRDDGTEGEFTLIGRNAQRVPVAISEPQMDEVIQALIGLAEAARFNRGKATTSPATIRATRPVFLCANLELALNPDGSVSFLIEDPKG